MKFSFNITNVKAIINKEYKEKYKGTTLEQYCNDFSLDFIPTIERRRLSIGAKCVLSIINNNNMPIIYTSYKGEINRSLDLLYTLADTSIVSPTSFSLSVLNAIPAVTSIINSNHNDILAVSTTPSLENALLQAYINMQDNNIPHTIISYFEEPNKEYCKSNNLYYALLLEVINGSNITIEAKNENNKGTIFNNSEIIFLSNYKNKTNYSIVSDNTKWSWFFND